MNRLTALALVVVLWAAIYLPGLGSTELKGEEGRRILPAITMLESGNWLVPYIGGEPYLRKPPLVNWAIAGMFRFTGIRNEWTARLPAALCVLALGLTIVATSGAGWIPVETAFIAAVMAMTQFGLLAKAKFAGAEIEGLYAPLTGMAIVCWLAWWNQRRSPWLQWSVAGLLLGLGCLAKGPSLHLVFFYVVVIGALWRGKALRQLWHPAHLLGLAVCAGVFAAWAVPYFQTPEAVGAAEVWKRQGIDRFTESDFNLGNYLTNLPRALGDQLPWLLLAPLVGRRWRVNGEPCVPIWAIVVCFVVVLLVPGTLPRYVLPLGAPIALLLAETAVQSGRFVNPRRLAIKLGVGFAVAMLLYAVFVVPRMNARDDLRPMAREIDATVPAGERLVLHDVGYLAMIFYLRTPYVYAPRTEDIPRDSTWILARASQRKRLAEKRPDFQVERTLAGKGKTELILLQRTTNPAER